MLESALGRAQQLWTIRSAGRIEVPKPTIDSKIPASTMVRGRFFTFSRTHKPPPISKIGLFDIRSSSLSLETFAAFVAALLQEEIVHKHAHTHARKPMQVFND